MALSPVDQLYQQLSLRHKAGIGITKPSRRIMNQIAANTQGTGMELLDYVGTFFAFSEKEWDRLTSMRSPVSSRKPEDKQKLAKRILSVVKKRAGLGPSKAPQSFKMREENEPMPDQNVNKMVDAAKNKDGAAFQSAFRQAMASKAGAALDAIRKDVAQNTFGGIKEAVLTTKQRKALPDAEFAIPDRGGDEEDDAYPIHDKSHARNALARVSAHGTEAEKKKVRAAVAKKFPDIGQG